MNFADLSWSLDLFSFIIYRISPKIRLFDLRLIKVMVQPRAQLGFWNFAWIFMSISLIPTGYFVELAGLFQWLSLQNDKICIWYEFIALWFIIVLDQSRVQLGFWKFAWGFKSSPAFPIRIFVVPGWRFHGVLIPWFIFAHNIKNVLKLDFLILGLFRPWVILGSNWDLETMHGFSWASYLFPWHILWSWLEFSSDFPYKMPKSVYDLNL